MKSELMKQVFKQAGMNLAASALTAAASAGVKLVYKKYIDNKINKELRTALADS